MIKIENLWFTYHDKSSYTLSDINVTIEDGEYVSVIGENGSGKTTLMRILLGFLKPVKGNITIDTNFIGYVPQRNDFSNTNFPITVYEVLNSYQKLLKINDKSIIPAFLSLTGTAHLSKSLIGNLSGGQTQKVLIARALMGNPKLLILDEPSTGVDADSQKEIYGLLKQMCTEHNVTIIAVEHNLQAAFTNSTKILHLQNGHAHFCSSEKYTKEYLQYQRKE